jgi:hypothetical protein
MSKQKQQQKQQHDGSSPPAARPGSGSKRHEKRHPQQQRKQPAAALLGAKALALAAAALLLAFYANAIAPGALPAVQRSLARYMGSSRSGDGSGGMMPSEPAKAEGGRLLGPSFGLYPRGCRWREVTYTNGSQEVRGAGG